jgi:chromosome segregation ATPase
MATVVETILEISADNSLKTLKDLKREISEYREQLNQLDVKSKEYKATQKAYDNALKELRATMSLYKEELKAAKEAQKEAARAAKEAQKEAARAAKEAAKIEKEAVVDVEGSYNAMVRTMGELTKAWRATGDEAERAKLGEKILEINTQLKELDASRGNFQRNVGNYQSAFNGLSISMSQVIRELPSLQMGMSTFVLAISNNLPILFDNIQRVNAELAEMRSQGQQVPSTVGAIVKSLKSWNTILMVATLAVQLLVSNWDKIAAIWRDKTPEELAKEAIEEMNAAIERQAQLIERENIEALRQYSAELRAAGGDADIAREALEKYNQTVRENALAQAEASRALAGDRVSQLKKELIDAETYLKELEDSMQAVAGTGAVVWYLNDIKAAKQAVEELKTAYDEANAELQKYVGEAVQAENAIAKAESDRAIQAAENAQKAEENAQKEIARLNELQAKINEVAGDFSWIGEAVADSMSNADLLPLPDFEEGLEEYEEYFDKVYEANKKFFSRQKKIAEAEEKAKKELTINATAEMFGNVASLFEENTAAYKAFAVAEATIATYSSAVKSFEQLGGWPFGLIGIASSIAAGMAQVKNILSVDTSGKSMSMPNQSAPAIVSAPAVVQEVPITRTMLDAGQEDRINSKFKDQRVYVVYSDIEGAGKRVNVQREESSF